MGAILLPKVLYSQVFPFPITGKNPDSRPFYKIPKCLTCAVSFRA